MRIATKGTLHQVTSLTQVRNHGRQPAPHVSARVVETISVSGSIVLLAMLQVLVASVVGEQVRRALKCCWMTLQRNGQRLLPKHQTLSADFSRKKPFRKVTHRDVGIPHRSSITMQFIEIAVDPSDNLLHLGDVQLRPSRQLMDDFVHVLAVASYRTECH